MVSLPVMSPTSHPISSGEAVRQLKLLALAPIIKVAALIFAHPRVHSQRCRRVRDRGWRAGARDEPADGEHRFLHDLVTGGIVKLATMTDAEYGIFHELTSTSPSLDDGEAATIAIAAARFFLPVIDERRGRNRASALLKTRNPGWPLDILRHPRPSWSSATNLSSKRCISLFATGACEFH